MRGREGGSSSFALGRKKISAPTKLCNKNTTQQVTDKILPMFLTFEIILQLPGASNPPLWVEDEPAPSDTVKHSY